MNEDIYPIDTAAEILGCQQKKILSEWATGSINIVLDFGDESKIDRGIYESVDRHYNRIAPWNSATITAPRLKKYYPKEIVTPEKKYFRNRDPFFFGTKPTKNDDMELGYYKAVYPSFFHCYSVSGFYFDDKYSHIHESKDNNLISLSNILLYGLWKISYSEYSRLHVQDTFILTPYSNKFEPSEITVEFTPSGASRRINAPEKKNLRITAADMEILKKLLSKRVGKQNSNETMANLITQNKPHGGIERFALEREKVLAAALYVKHHYPQEIGKTFSSHAQCITKYAYELWTGDDYDIAPDTNRIAKILSDATKKPSDWKILGGKANKNK